MRRLSSKLLLVCGELHELHLQRRIQVDFWGVLSVRDRKLQAVAGIRLVHPMRRRHVFNSWGIDMPRLFARLQLA